jgi:hypothetical protein
MRRTDEVRRTRSDADPPRPVHGTPGGYRDIWDSPDEAALLKARREAVARQVASLGDIEDAAPRRSLVFVTGSNNASEVSSRG